MSQVVSKVEGLHGLLMTFGSSYITQTGRFSAVSCILPSPFSSSHQQGLVDTLQSLADAMGRSVVDNFNGGEALIRPLTTKLGASTHPCITGSPAQLLFPFSCLLPT